MWNGDGTHHFTDGNPLIFWLSQYLVIISQYLHKLTNELKTNWNKGDSYIKFINPSDPLFLNSGLVSITIQGRRKVWKSGGARSTVVGKICPPGWDRVSCLAKKDLPAK